MAHYAFLDTNYIVTEVIVGKDENEDDTNWEIEYSKIKGQMCKRTSYNTKGGIHYDTETKQPSNDQTKSFRKNYAGIGYTYNFIRDAFIPPRPYNSWTLNEETCLWEPPTPIPEDAGTGEPPKRYAWDEITTSWVDITPSE